MERVNAAAKQHAGIRRSSPRRNSFCTPILGNRGQDELNVVFRERCLQGADLSTYAAFSSQY
eukprot:6140290-Pyramimonas_sp.AAC.1